MRVVVWCKRGVRMDWRAADCVNVNYMSSETIWHRWRLILQCNQKKKIMYADNLFTLNNIPTLSAVQGGLGVLTGNVTSAGRDGCEGGLMCPSDKLFVSVVQYGRTVLDLVLAGIGSMAELMRVVKCSLGPECGLVTVNVRNGSQGWSLKRCVRLNRAVPRLADVCGV